VVGCWPGRGVVVCVIWCRRAKISMSLSRSPIGRRRSIARALVTPRYARCSSMGRIIVQWSLAIRRAVTESMRARSRPKARNRRDQGGRGIRHPQGPVPADQASVPGQQGGRGDDAMSTSTSGKPTGTSPPDDARTNSATYAPSISSDTLLDHLAVGSVVSVGRGIAYH
jgi:hypothetical protein